MNAAIVSAKEDTTQSSRASWTIILDYIVLQGASHQTADFAAALPPLPPLLLFLMALLFSPSLLPLLDFSFLIPNPHQDYTVAAERTRSGRAAL